MVKEAPESVSCGPLYSERQLARQYCLAQVSEALEAAGETLPEAGFSYSVPTGNFGDVLAGYYAKRMGLPVDKLVVATNENDILHRCDVVTGVVF